MHVFKLFVSLLRCIQYLLGGNACLPWHFLGQVSLVPRPSVTEGLGTRLGASINTCRLELIALNELQLGGELIFGFI